MQPSQLLTGVLSGAFLLYITYSLWTLSRLFKVTSCNEAFDHCIPPIIRDGDHLQVNVAHYFRTFLFCCYLMIVTAYLHCVSRKHSPF